MEIDLSSRKFLSGTAVPGTGGAVVQHCQLIKKGRTISRFQGGLPFHYPVKTDYWCLQGILRPIDPKAEEIRFEIGIPLRWNGKAIHQGGGGLDGFVPCAASGAGMCYSAPDGPDALTKGYAVFGSDSGHRLRPFAETDCRWGLNQENLDNFAAGHLKKTYDAAMQTLEICCGKRPECVYFIGGSNGGRECLKALQMHPEDYSGAICLYPAIYFSLIWLAANRNADALEELGGKAMIRSRLLNQVKQCTTSILDGLDGLKDGIVSPWALSQEHLMQVEAELSKILSPEQLAYLKLLAGDYQLPYTLDYGENSLPGYQVFLGADISGYYGLNSHGTGNYLTRLARNALACFALRDPHADVRHLDVQKHKAEILQMARLIDSGSPDLDAYFAAGKKLILLQGNMDMMVSVRGTVRYYERLKQRYGTSLAKNLAFFYAPGYGHGFGGNIEFSVDLISVLEAWTERSERPDILLAADQIKATKGRTRPIYEYPFYAAYQGTGDIDRAENFIKRELSEEGDIKDEEQ